jgi:trimethylamine:corrinoid methyltransferase-like protein
MESALGASVLPWGSGDIGGHIGLLGGAMILFPEQIILDHEICKTVYDLFCSVEFDSNSMALDVIKEVRPRNDFLTHSHTLEHIRDYRISPILHPHKTEGVEISPRQAALEKYNRIDHEHRPAPLSKAIQKELDRVLAAADRQIKNAA